uniref:Putative ovule protein n=1 Tax=Solanum chacoense TaxID=4108 RepID=A0A0V0GYT8_SOLCH
MPLYMEHWFSKLTSMAKKIFSPTTVSLNCKSPRSNISSSASFPRVKFQLRLSITSLTIAGIIKRTRNMFKKVSHN